jgi:hypothetical protein
MLNIFGVFANNQDQNANLMKIKLDEVSVDVPYDEKEVKIERKELKNEIQVVIKDKNTNQVLDIFGELKSKNNLKISASTNNISLGATESTYNKIVYSTKSIGPTDARLYAVLEIYSYSSFRQINKVVDTYWAEASSGNWKLEREYSSSYMTKTPDYKATIMGTANITVETTNETTGEFSIEFLEKAGFSVSHAVGSTYYARTPIEHSFTYSLY